MNKHLTINNVEYIGHLEPALTDNTTIDQSEAHSTNSITLQKMMAEQLKLDTFDPPNHKFKPGIQNKLDALLKEYESQFAKDETSIGTTPLTQMTIDTGTSCYDLESLVSCYVLTPCNDFMFSFIWLANA